MKLSKFAIHKPISTIMIVLSIVVMGFISLFRLPLEYLPSMTYPVLYVTTFYPSSSPAEVERFITRPIEEILSTMAGIESIGSTSSESSSTVRIEFPMGADMNLVGIHLRDRIDQVRSDLPEDIRPPIIKTFSTDNIPVYEASLSLPGQPKEALKELYEKIVYPRLLRLKGVADVSMKGSDRKQLIVEVDQKALLAHKIDLRTINRSLSRNNVNISAGYVTDGGKRIAVRSVGEFDAVDQIRQLPIRHDLVLEDIATVTYGYPNMRGRNDWLDGRPAKVLTVQKSSTANVVDVCKLIRRELALIQAEIGRDQLKIHVIRDTSTAIIASITSLSQSAIMGGFLAIIAIFIFLRNFRSTLIIGSAIPISAFTVFLIMYLLRQSGSDITLNLIS
ncbi:MAG: efflux RND transporter permease subunit, partial [Candidatus Latescibacteria bacterium]|nr:efflux RND transporter permease subunit [Candidatus Latescibacterota bacterium]